MTSYAATPADSPDVSRARRLVPGEPISKIGDLLKLPPGQRAGLIGAMTPEDCARLYYDWSLWARPEQEPPPGDWVVWLILAGRGAGKTRAGAEAVRRWIEKFAIVNLIGATADDVRDVMVLGDSGLLNICPDGERPRYLPSAARLEWPNGAVSLLFSAEEPDRLRGKQHMKLWCDELAAWRRPDAFDQALLGLRLGDKPQAVVTTTPRPTKIIKQLAADKDTIVTRGSTFDNKGHLAKAFLERIARRYEGRVIGRQELMAEIVEETPGSLWTRALLERQRVQPENAPWWWSASIRRRAPARRPTNAALSSPERRRTGASMCSPTCRARGTRRQAGPRASAPPIADFPPTGSWPKSTTAVTWWRRSCVRPSRICRCARCTQRAASSCAPSRSRRPTNAGSCSTRASSRSSRTSFARSPPTSTGGRAPRPTGRTR